MKNWKSLPILFLTLFTITFLNTSCNEGREADEAVSYDVTVDIISPSNNTQMAVGEVFSVIVDYARNENIIHNIKVEIVDMDGNQVQSLVERHAHVANEFTFTAENVSINRAGTYFVRASTTDLHDGDEGAHNGEGGDNDNLVEHTFTLQ